MRAISLLFDAPDGENSLFSTFLLNMQATLVTVGVTHIRRVWFCVRLGQGAGEVRLETPAASE